MKFSILPEKWGRLPSGLAFGLFLLTPLSPLTAQTIFRDASGQIPPAQVVTDPGQGPNASSDTPDVLFADFDKDGDMDVYVAEGTNSVFGRVNRLLFNDGSGNFTDVTSSNLPPSNGTAPFGFGPGNSSGIDVGDIDGDGDTDIAVANLGNNELFYNNGDGTFSDASNLLPPPPVSPITPFDNISVDAELADVDGDGDLDIFFANEIPPIPPFGPNGSQNRLYIQQANGTFTDETGTRLPAFPNVSQKIKTLDLDGDGDLDVLEANVDGARILINNGAGFYTDESATRLPASARTGPTRGLGLGDIDRDGDTDFIFANSNNQPNQVLINNGNGVFTDESATRLPTNNRTSVDVELFDIDFDGDLDLLFSNNSLIFNPPNPPAPGPAPNSLLLNDGNGSFSLAPPTFLPQTSNSTFAIQVGDLSGDGLEDIFVCNAGGAAEELYIRDITPRIPDFRDPDLRPQLICVEDNEDGSYSARFGYKNSSGEPLYVPKGFFNGILNFSFPFDEQPVVFLSGGTNAFPEEVFEVRLAFFTLWSLNGRFAFASFLSQPCGSGKTTPQTFEPESISLFPNPGQNDLNLMGVNDDDWVEVYDMQGKKVVAEFGKFTVDMSLMPKGMYLVKVNTLSVGKWIKQ